MRGRIAVPPAGHVSVESATRRAGRDSIDQEVQVPEMQFLSQMFPDERPLFISVAEEHGYGVILDQLVEKAFAKGEAITDPRAIQAILLVASMRCQSNYCSVFHSLILNTLDVTPEQIKHIVSHRKFPDSMSELRQYDEFLDHAFYRKRIYVDDDFSFIANARRENAAAAQRDYLAILLLSDFLNMLTVAFCQELNLDLETYFTAYPTHDRIDDYVKFFWNAKKSDPDEESPVLEICARCKCVKNQSTQVWESVERVIPMLPKNARFSHAYCDPCRDAELDALASKGVAIGT